jgi:hypothetical protein
VEKIVLENLRSEEVIDLWLGGYLELSEEYILEHFDIDNSVQIKRLLNRQSMENNIYKTTFKKLYEQYFLDFKNSEFEEEYPKLVKRLLIYKEGFSKDFSQTFEILELKFNVHQKFLLWIFNAPVSFDAKKYVIEYVDRLSDYHKIRFLFTAEISEDEFLTEWSEILCISQEGLEQSVKYFKWNTLVSPINLNKTGDETIIAFINDIETYIKQFKQPEINLKQLAKVLYDSLEKYQVHHIRLWLSGLINEYDYLGYRNSFKELSTSEKKYFKNRLNEIKYEEDVIEPEIEEVTVARLIEKTGNISTYEAFIENFYFSNDFCSLRREDERYTNDYNYDMVSTSFNRILKSDKLNCIPITVKVNHKNEITEIIGLEDIINEIHTQNIKKALGSVFDETGKTNGRYDNSYTEDWALRKQIIDLLNDIQDKSVDLKLVNEPKKYFGRLKTGDIPTAYEMVTLFSIKTADGGYIIVWENTDLSNDRATYIFKTLDENLYKQLDKIADAISSLAQLRATLSSNKISDNMLKIFKDNLGYIKSIKKQRGQYGAFEDWKVKLEAAFLEKIPPLPNNASLLKLEDWQSKGIKHSPRINRKVEKIDTGNLKKFDMGFSKQPNSSPKKGENRKNTIFESLKKFNEKFLDKLEIYEK